MKNRRTFLKSGLVSLVGFPVFFVPGMARANSTIVLINSLNNVQMLNSTWGRPVALPAAWNTVRVGLLLHTDDPGAGLSSTPIINVGLCHNTTNMIGDATTDHFAGIQTTAASWNYVASCTGNGAFLYSISVKALVNVAGTATLSGSTIATDVRLHADTTHRGHLFVDITKGSPNYSFNVWNEIASCSPDANIATFLSNVALASPISPVTQGSSQSLAVNEATNGSLNTVNVYWNRADLALNICALAVAVLA